MRVLREVVSNGARLARALLALGILAALVGGLPWLLARFVGWPLPGHIPTWDEVQVFLTSPFTDQVLIDILACACWLAWAAFTVETILAVIDATADLRRRGETRPGHTRPPGPGRMRPLGRVATALVSAVIVAGTPGPRDATHLHLAAVSAVAADVRQPGLAASNDSVARGLSVHQPTVHAGGDGPRARQVVVRPPRGDRHDSLWRIAERELGDPRLWPAIYDLNVGKRQPDGQRLWDPDLLQPGWVLELPERQRVSEPSTPGAPGDGDRIPPAGSQQPTSPAENESTSRPTPLPSSPSLTPSRTAPPAETPTSTTSTTRTASPAETSAPSDHTPAAAAPQSRTVGVELTTGGYVGIGLVIAVSALLGITRLRRRRRDPLTGPMTFRLPLQLAPGEPPPAVVQALRRAHLSDALRRHERTTHPSADTDVLTPQVLPRLDDDQLRRIWSDPDTWAVRSSIATDTAAAHAAVPATTTTTTTTDQPGLVVDIGTKHESEVRLDLARVRALGIHGSGDVSVARAITAALLARVRYGHPARLVDIVTTHEDAARLLGHHLDDPAPPGLHVAANARDALDLAEERLATPTDGDTPQPLVLLLLTPDLVVRTRAQAILRQRPNAYCLFLGSWPEGLDLTVAGDGTVTDAALASNAEARSEEAADPVSAPELNGARLFHLAEGELAGILHTARAASSADARRAAPPAGDTSHRGTASLRLVPGDQAPQPIPRMPAQPEPVDAPVVASHTEVSATPSGSDGAAQEAPAPATTAAAPSPTPNLPPGRTRATQAETATGPVTAWAEAARTGAGQWSPVVTVEVLGPPRVTVQGQPQRHGLRGKTQELLMFLVLHPEGATPAAISEALWPGQTDTSNMLRSAMKRVRTHLKQATGLDQAFILYGDGRYRPDRRVIGCDAWQFEAATELAGRASGDDAERAAALADAVTLYRGQLLDGADYLWADAYREALRHHALQAYVRYAAALETDDPEAALAALERALAIDPYNETLYRRVMTLQARLGRPEAIAGTLQLLRRQLADIDEDPERQTLVLAASLQRAGSEGT